MDVKLVMAPLSMLLLQSGLMEEDPNLKTLSHSLKLGTPQSTTFFFPRSTTWDSQRLLSFFDWQSAKEIAHLDTGTLDDDDFRYWLHSKPGVYTVKSGYFLLSNSHPPKDSPSFFRLIWVLNILPKLKLFYGHYVLIVLHYAKNG